MRNFVLAGMMVLTVPAFAQDVATMMAQQAADANQQIQMQTQQMIATQTAVTTQQMIDQQMMSFQQGNGSSGGLRRLDIIQPTFSLKSGTYNSPQRLKLIDSDHMATIYFTLDGTIPSTRSPKFTMHHRPIVIAATTHVRAIAISGKKRSLIADAVFTLPNQAPKPVQAPTQSPSTARPSL
ncbi:MAG: chitobiase/beta-hexosaminidase C-terminal domain-containing protein [Acidobacteriota bacterium]